MQAGLAKIISNTKPFGECLIWQGYKNDDGYGCVMFKNKPWKIHRLVYTLVNGPVKDLVLHRCDMPACINPWYLFEGTQDDNMKDAASKRRLVRGESHPKAVLTQEKVDYIRSLYANGRAPYGTRKRLAKELNCSYWTIDQVLRGTTWLN